MARAQSPQLAADGSAPPGQGSTPGAVALDYSAALPALDNRALVGELVWLALPVLAEHTLNIVVGMTDVFLAGHLETGAAAATAAVGSVSYVLWLIGLVAGAIGTGSTAIIARAVGARHRSLANSVAGQSVGAAALVGVVLAMACAAGAVPLARFTGLTGDAYQYALYYFRVLALAIPFMVVMLTCGSCLRGAGDTLSAALAMITVDVVNLLVSAALTRGWLGLPKMGFRGIAIGTVTAYAVGGVLLLVVLFKGRRRQSGVGIKLYLHRLRPHWQTLRRVLRVGLPSGFADTLTWVAQFFIVVIINRIDPTNVSAAAHIVTIRVESLSYMTGFAVSVAAATMVGQSLGMRNPARATRTAYLAYFIGAGAMALCAVAFLLFGRDMARVLTSDPRTVGLAGRCLFIAGFAQLGFAAAIVFGGALRGAGDTVAVMTINLASTIGLRLVAVLVVTLWLGYGLAAVWIVLSTELSVRGVLMYLRFLQGGWKHVKV